MVIVENESSIFGDKDDFIDKTERLTVTIILFFLTFLGILLNGFIVYVIVSLGRYTNVPANLFVLNQAIANLGNAVSVLSYITHLYYWNWEIIYCLLSLTLFSSLGSLCLLTINRLISIVCPLKYPRRMTPFRAKFLVGITWTAAMILTFLHMIGYLAYSDGNFFNYGRYYMMLLILICVSSNAYMFCKSRIHARKINKTFRGVITGLQRNFTEDLKSVKTIAMVSMTFFLGWLPMILIFFIYGSEKEGKEFQRYCAFLSIFMALNIVSDPVIYYYRSAEFRMFYQRWRRQRGVAMRSSRIYTESRAFHVKILEQYT